MPKGAKRTAKSSNFVLTEVTVLAGEDSETLYINGEVVSAYTKLHTTDVLDFLHDAGAINYRIFYLKENARLPLPGALDKAMKYVEGEIEP